MTDKNYYWEDKTFLIVEDTFSNYELLATFLKKTGARLIWAKDGSQAIDICKSGEDVNLILMDIQLQSVNGYEATRQIKKINPGLPIIAQTAYAMAGDREKSLKAGCDDYLAKPIRKNTFFETISKYIK